MNKTIISLDRKNRDSNFELARIVAMMMIVIGHFVVHGIWQTEFCYRIDLQNPLSCTFENLIYSFCVCGVNIFVLISGYHKIKLKLKSFLSLWSLCAFYGIIAVLVNSHADTPLLPELIKSLFISNSQWFFKAYLWLLILSPVLNAGLDSMSLVTLRRFVLILFILNCFSGWVLNNANVDGYNVLQLMFVYIIGHWLSREPLVKRFNSAQYFVLFVLMSILICVGAVLSLLVLSGSNFGFYYYNNPLIVLTSIAVFCGFSQLNVQSNIINMIASTVVAALFIQDFIASRWIYESVYDASNNGIVSLVLCCVAWFVFIFLSAFIVDNIRQKISKPIISRVEHILGKYCN
jgi:surface polysaccharide O-acyltransferase-like enzyme